jgi:hypothetical protein
MQQNDRNNVLSKGAICPATLYNYKYTSNIIAWQLIFYVKNN